MPGDYKMGKIDEEGEDSAPPSPAINGVSGQEAETKVKEERESKGRDRDRDKDRDRRKSRSSSSSQAAETTETPTTGLRDLLKSGSKVDKAKINKSLLALLKNQVQVTEDFSQAMKDKISKKDTKIGEMEVEVNQLRTQLTNFQRDVTQDSATQKKRARRLSELEDELKQVRVSRAKGGPGAEGGQGAEAAGGESKGSPVAMLVFFLFMVLANVGSFALFNPSFSRSLGIDAHPALTSARATLNIRHSTSALLSQLAVQEQRNAQLFANLTVAKEDSSDLRVQLQDLRAVAGDLATCRVAGVRLQEELMAAKTDGSHRHAVQLADCRTSLQRAQDLGSGHDARDANRACQEERDRFGVDVDSLKLQLAEQKMRARLMKEQCAAPPPPRYGRDRDYHDRDRDFRGPARYGDYDYDGRDMYGRDGRDGRDNGRGRGDSDEYYACQSALATAKTEAQTCQGVLLETMETSEGKERERAARDGASPLLHPLLLQCNRTLRETELANAQLSLQVGEMLAAADLVDRLHQQLGEAERVATVLRLNLTTAAVEVREVKEEVRELQDARALLGSCQDNATALGEELERERCSPADDVGRQLYASEFESLRLQVRTLVSFDTAVQGSLLRRVQQCRSQLEIMALSLDLNSTELDSCTSRQLLCEANLGQAAGLLKTQEVEALKTEDALVVLKQQQREAEVEAEGCSADLEQARSLVLVTREEARAGQQQVRAQWRQEAEAARAEVAKMDKAQLLLEVAFSACDSELEASAHNQTLLRAECAQGTRDLEDDVQRAQQRVLEHQQAWGKLAAQQAQCQADQEEAREELQGCTARLLAMKGTVEKIVVLEAGARKAYFDRLQNKSLEQSACLEELEVAQGTHRAQGHNITVLAELHTACEGELVRFQLEVEAEDEERRRLSERAVPECRQEEGAATRAREAAGQGELRRLRAELEQAQEAASTAAGQQAAGGRREEALLAMVADLENELERARQEGDGDAGQVEVEAEAEAGWPRRGFGEVEAAGRVAAIEAVGAVRAVRAGVGPVGPGQEVVSTEELAALRVASDQAAALQQALEEQVQALQAEVEGRQQEPSAVYNEEGVDPADATATAEAVRVTREDLQSLEAAVGAAEQGLREAQRTHQEELDQLQASVATVEQQASEGRAAAQAQAAEHAAELATLLASSEQRAEGLEAEVDRQRRKLRGAAAQCKVAGGLPADDEAAAPVLNWDDAPTWAELTAGNITSASLGVTWMKYSLPFVDAAVRVPSSEPLTAWMAGFSIKHWPLERRVLLLVAVALLDVVLFQLFLPDNRFFILLVGLAWALLTLESLVFPVLATLFGCNTLMALVFLITPSRKLRWSWGSGFAVIS